MKINFDSILNDIDGNPLLASDKELTLKKAAIEALMNMTDADRHESGEDKFKRYELAVKINSGGEIELSPEEAALIKRRIGIGYSPVVVGPAFKLLNG